MTGSRLVLLAALVLSGGGSAVAAPPGTLDGCVHAGKGTVFLRFAVGKAESVPAAMLGTGATGIVLSDESDLDLCSWLPFARTLAGQGYRVILYDFQSASPDREAAGAARALLAAGARRVVLAGASEGAKASILAAARTPHLAAVVALSPERALLGRDVTPAARKLRVPALFAVSKDDPYSAVDTPALAAAAGSPRKRLVEVPGSDHGVALLSGAPSATVGAAFLDFLGPFGPPRRAPSLASECGASAGAPPSTSFALTTSDGIHLHGVALGSGATAVVLSHEYPRDLCGWFPYASELVRDGLRVVLYDSRAFGSRLDLDVAAAIDEARALGSTTVVAMGASLGGAATLLAGARDCLLLSGIVSVSGEPDLRSFGAGVPPIDVWPYAAHLSAPLLLVGSRDDGLVTPADLGRLVQTARSTRKRALIVVGSAHGWNLLQGPGRSDAARVAVSAFLQAAGPPVPTGCSA